MANRWKRRPRRRSEGPTRGVFSGARAEGPEGAAEGPEGAAEGPEGAAEVASTVRVPVLGPYELRYDVSGGYTQERQIEVR